MKCRSFNVLSGARKKEEEEEIIDIIISWRPALHSTSSLDDNANFPSDILEDILTSTEVLSFKKYEDMPLVFIRLNSNSVADLKAFLKTKYKNKVGVNKSESLSFEAPIYSISP